jgi:hypothetical protein
VSTAYAIFRVDRTPDGDPLVRIVHVFWDEEQAVEMVRRLNGTSTSGSGDYSYSWSPVWVARPDADRRVHLTPKDREYLLLARAHEALGTERPLAVFFSFIFNKSGAQAACEELGSLGWPDVGYDEELEGDECWHVYAHRRRLILSAEAILLLRTEMEDLAERHGGRFDHWDVSGGSGLRWAKPGELPR